MKRRGRSDRVISTAVENVMCDYSLHDVRSRKAEKGDNLALSKFGGYHVTGFGRPADGADCVTCLPHGTTLRVTGKDGKTREAIFGHNDNGSWSDGLIFADTPSVVLSLQNLPIGMRAEVVELPLAQAPTAAADAGTLLEHVI